MLIKFYYLCVVIFLCEAATKIGLGNGRPSEEPSSLKTEVLKFKTSECGGDSSEEQPHNSKNKKPKNRNKKGSDEDDDDDDSEEDNKKKNKNNAGKNNNTRNRQKSNRGWNREEMFTGYGSTSFEHNRHFGMNLGPPDDYMNRRQGPGGDQFPNRWDEDQNRSPYNSNPRATPGNHGNHGNQFNPYGPTFGGEDDFHPQNSNRNQNRGQDPYQQPRPGPLTNRGGYPFQQDRDDNDRYNNRDRDDRYNNRDDRFGNRRKPQQSHWDDSSSEDDSSRNGGKRNGQRNNRRPSNRNGGMKGNNKKNKNNNSDGDCISQCVFNNMEIMEDDGIPSEAGMIKWAQDKIKNDKLKQAAVKEIRKCFGTLASSDGDNSCNFSKSLSNCLKLGLDDDKD